MKKSCKLSLILLIAIICLSVFVITAAAQSKGPQLFNYHTTDDSLETLIYAKSDERLTKSNFTLKIGDKEYEPDSLTTYTDSDYATSWIVVIESANNYKTLENAVKALVEQIVSGMSGSDNMAVYTTYGDKYSFNTDKKTINTVVSDTMRKISTNSSDKKLYDAIYSAIDTLKTDASLNDHKSLVVISEWADTNSSHTFNDVKNVAADFNGTIYMVGLTQQLQGKKADFDSARVLADSNLSGDAYTMDTVDDATGKSIATQIRNNEGSCRILSTRLDKITEAGEGELPINVTFQTGNMRIDTNALSVKADDLKPAEGTEKTVLTPTVNDGETNNDDNKEEKDNNLKYYIIGGAAAVLIIAAIIILTRKKKPAAPPTPPTPPTHSIKDSPTRNVSGDPVGTKVTGVSTMPVSKVTITLTKIDTGETVKGEIMDSSIKAGREQKLRLTGDSGISGSHMEFIWQNGILYVQDTKSLNGTFVNKKKITGAVQLQQSDVIHAGSTDYRVNWKSNS